MNTSKLLALIVVLPFAAFAGEITDQFVKEAREAYRKDPMCHVSVAGKYYAKGHDDVTPGKTVKWVEVEGVRNVRDIGGWNGLKSGMVFRGTELGRVNTIDGNSHGYNITEAGRKTMREYMGIVSDFDLRAVTKSSRGEYVTKSALDPDTRLLDHPIGAYMDCFTYNGEKLYGKALRQFADPSIYPVYVHCAGGADRTGTLCFLLETLCGVPLEDARIDYELTGFSPVGSRLSNRESVQPFATMVRTLSTYPGEAFRDKVEYYALNVLKLTAEEIASIRRTLCAASKPDSENGSFREDAAKYWDFARLSRAPSWRSCEKRECQFPGLKAMLVKGVGPNGTEAEFFAYYAHPEVTADSRRFPGIVLTHGGGGTAFPNFILEWVKKGFAVIAIDWYNQCPAPGLADGPYRGDASMPRIALPGGKRNDIVASAANMVLAHSLLLTQPEVDQEHTVFVGLSWGSWYGAIVSSIDPRFKGVVEIYCGDVTKDVKRRGSLVNGRFLWQAKCPMWWITWTQDVNVSPQSSQAAWEECPQYRGHFTGTRIGHSHYGFRYASVERMAKCFAGLAPSLPVLGRIELRDGVLLAPVVTPGASGVGVAELTYTDDAAGANTPAKRLWKHAPAEVKDGIVSAQLPEGALIAYLTLYEGKKPEGDLGGSSHFWFAGGAR